MENTNITDAVLFFAVICAQNEQKRCESDASSVRAHLFCSRAYFTHNTQQLRTQKQPTKSSENEVPLLCGTCLKKSTPHRVGMARMNLFTNTSVAGTFGLKSL